MVEFPRRDDLEALEKVTTGETPISASMAHHGESPARCALILTALELETRAVLRHMPDRKTELVTGTVFHRGVVEGWDVVVAEVGPGNAPAAVIAERAIGRFGPAVALFVGVAGGIKDVAIGDVVATKVYGYEWGTFSRGLISASGIPPPVTLKTLTRVATASRQHLRHVEPPQQSGFGGLASFPPHQQHRHPAMLSQTTNTIN
jgi:nucleoside phosphorylase